VETQSSFEVFRPSELQMPVSKLEFIKGFPFEFELGSKMVHEMGSSAKGSKNPTTQTSLPKYVEEVDVEVMQANKATEVF
jgi:hypothetical protein